MCELCVFCGKPIEGGQVCCADCEGILEELTPEQRQALEKCIQETKNWAELNDALNKLKKMFMECLDPALKAVLLFADVIHGRKQDGK